jgi:hypothetical protein
LLVARSMAVAASFWICAMTWIRNFLLVRALGFDRGGDAPIYLGAPVDRRDRRGIEPRHMLRRFGLGRRHIGARLGRRHVRLWTHKTLARLSQDARPLAV